MKTALIVDIDRLISLPVIRSLGRAGIRVLGISSLKYPIGRFSKYCRKSFQVSDPNTCAEHYIDELVKLCEEHQPDVLVPITENTIRLLGQHKHRWHSLTRSLLPSGSAMELLGDKWATLSLASSVGIATPKSYCPGSPEQFAQLQKHWTGPFVVKPRNSQGSIGVCYGNGANELADAYQSLAHDWPKPIIQEKIPLGGEAVGVSVLLDQKGDLVASFCHRRIREYPVVGGPSTLCESIHCPQLLEMSLTLLKAAGMTGVAMVEYKWDVNQEKYVLMEVNPRFWGSLSLPISAGVNFPLMYFRLAVGEPVDKVNNYEDGLQGRWLWPGDLLHFIHNPNRLKLNPGFFRFFEKRLSYYVISTDDPLPMFGMLFMAFRKLKFRRPDPR